MAAEAREPYDHYDDKHADLVLDALDEERRADETDLDEYDNDDWADEEMWEGAFR
ncbi:hypothetical protein ABT215_43405 [Streptomyces sp900105755]|uniref:hypothetical protein n=1 Tax=Streptomyces sp. 900105755 TaxID=3154389 RepID=UPI00332FA0A6